MIPVSIRVSLPSSEPQHNWIHAALRSLEAPGSDQREGWMDGGVGDVRPHKCHLNALWGK